VRCEAKDATVVEKNALSNIIGGKEEREEDANNEAASSINN
jgi:hypothetical protein